MPSKIQVDQIAGATGSTVTLPSGQTLDLSSGTVNLPSASLSALNASNLTSGTVPSARLSLTSSDLPTVPTTKGGTGLTTIGTAAQVLRVNSGATGLEFASASSDFVKLASTTVSSAVGGITLDGYFTSDYDTYIYQFYDFDFDGTNSVGVRFRSANAQLSASNYRIARGNDFYIDNGGSISSGAAGNWGLDFLKFNMDDTGTGTGNAVSQGELILHKPLDTSNYKMANGYFNYYRMDAATVQRTQFNGLYDATTAALSGVTFMTTTGNFTRGTIKLYGIKN